MTFKHLLPPKIYVCVQYNAHCVKKIKYKKNQDTSITITFGAELVRKSGRGTVNFVDIGGRETTAVIKTYKITVINIHHGINHKQQNQFD